MLLVCIRSYYSIVISIASICVFTLNNAFLKYVTLKNEQNIITPSSFRIFMF